MAKGKKTGGRKKGSRNRSVSEVKDLVDAIFKKVNPVEKAIKLLEFGSDKTQGTVLLRLLEYRYGKPEQPITGGRDDTEPIRVVVEHTGASAEFFAKQAVVLGLK